MVTNLSMVQLKGIALVIVFSFASNTSCHKKAPSDPAERVTVTPVEVLTLKPSSYQEYGSFLGTVVPVEAVELAAYGGGRVDEVHVRSGDRVKKQQRLCSVEGVRFDTALEAAKIAEKIAKERYERNQRHLSQGTASQLAVDEAHLDYLNSRSNRINAQKNHTGAFCLAPFDGIVVATHIERFDELSPGQKTIAIARLDEVKVIAGVPETQITGYKSGRAASVVNSANIVTHTGTVRSVGLSINTRDRTFPIEAMIDNRDLSLLPGATARIKVLKHELDNQVVVPNEVIINQANRRIVMVMEEDLARVREVRVGLQNATHATIESGLQLGDRVIIRGQSVAADGAPVKVIGQSAGEGES